MTAHRERVLDAITWTLMQSEVETLDAVAEEVLGRLSCLPTEDLMRALGADTGAEIRAGEWVYQDVRGNSIWTSVSDEMGPLVRPKL